LVVEFPAGSPAERVVAAAAARGVALSTLDRYFTGPPALNGLILGYGAATLTQVRRAATVVGPLLASLSWPAASQLAVTRGSAVRRRPAGLAVPPDGPGARAPR